jgi:hypothetical protein
VRGRTDVRFRGYPHRDELFPEDMQEGDFVYIANAGAYTTAHASTSTLSAAGSARDLTVSLHAEESGPAGPDSLSTRRARV